LNQFHFGDKDIFQGCYDLDIGKTDICNHIGVFTGNWTPNKICRLYFDPNEFPLPTDIDKGGVNETFHQLKTYIKAVSDTEGSPVICSSGSKIRHNKVFICKKNKSSQRKLCPFSFLLSWDEHGYFIHLYSLSRTRWNSCGCPWHCFK